MEHLVNNISSLSKQPTENNVSYLSVLFLMPGYFLCMAWKKNSSIYLNNRIKFLKIYFMKSEFLPIKLKYWEYHLLLVYLLLINKKKEHCEYSSNLFSFLNQEFFMENIAIVNTNWLSFYLE